MEKNLPFTVSPNHFTAMSTNSGNSFEAEKPNGHNVAKTQKKMRLASDKPSSDHQAMATNSGNSLEAEKPDGHNVTRKKKKKGMASDKPSSDQAIATTSGRSFEEAKSDGYNVTRKQKKMGLGSCKLSYDQAMARTSQRSFEEAKPDLVKLSSMEGKKENSYFFCFREFYTFPEIIDYMKEKHGCEKTEVTNVFREVLKDENAEAYLRESQKRKLTRMNQQDSV